MEGIIIKEVAPVFYREGTSVAKVFCRIDNEKVRVYYKDNGTLVPLITDRTLDDIVYWQELREKVISQTATAEETTEYFTFALRGCLNFNDFNRYGRILNYLATQGTQITYPTEPKIDWALNDDVTTEELNKMLANIAVIRNLTGTPPTTPQVPTTIKDFNDANTIETILKVGDETIKNTQLGFQYTGNQTYTNGTY